MPRLIVFCLDAGFAGTDSHEFEAFPDDVTEDELNEEAWQRALNHAESYGIYPYEEMPEDYDEEEADWNSDAYSGNIEGYWEDFDPEKHDGLGVGSTVTELFERLLKEFNE